MLGHVFPEWPLPRQRSFVIPRIVTVNVRGDRADFVENGSYHRVWSNVSFRDGSTCFDGGEPLVDDGQNLLLGNKP